MKNLRSESGFSHLLIFLIILLMGAIGFAGWRVFSNSKKQPTQTLQPPVQQPETEEKVESKIPDGFVEYKSDKLGVSFIYPKTWQEVALNQNEKDNGDVLKLISPTQKKAFEAFVRSGRATEGPFDFDLKLSKWNSINNKYFGDPSEYKNLEDYITNKNSSAKKIGEFKIGQQKVFEVEIGGIGLSYGIIFEKKDKSVYQFNFINIWDKSKVDQGTKAIVDSINIY